MNIKGRLKRIENKTGKQKCTWSGYKPIRELPEEKKKTWPKWLPPPILGGVSRGWGIPPQAKLKGKGENKL
jgi:hypothetical protein